MVPLLINKDIELGMVVVDTVVLDTVVLVVMVGCGGEGGVGPGGVGDTGTVVVEIDVEVEVIKLDAGPHEPYGNAIAV